MINNRLKIGDLVRVVNWTLYKNNIFEENSGWKDLIGKIFMISKTNPDMDCGEMFCRVLPMVNKCIKIPHCFLEKIN